MRKALLAIILALTAYAPAYAATWFVRNAPGNVGGNTTQCSGMTDTNYPGSGSGLQCAFASLQDGINAASYGDTIIGLEGSTSDQVTLPSKTGTPSYITVKSSGETSIPLRLRGVINTDASRMFKIATTQTNFAVSIPSGRSHWKFIGFEITTANRSQYYQILVDHIGNQVDFERSWIHSLEDYTNLTEASTRIGMAYSGSNSTFTGVRMAYFSAYVLGTTIVDNNFAFIFSGTDLTFTNCYLGAWFNAFISGGSSFSPAVNATVSGTPTMSSATLSTTAGLSVGMLAAFRNYPQRTLTNACSFVSATRTLTCTGGNFTNAYLDLGTAGTPAFFFPHLGASGAVESVTNSTTLVLRSNSVPFDVDFTNQTVNIDGVYGAVKIDSITGNDVTFTPWGITALQAPPEVPGDVQWEGEHPSGLTIRKTEFHNNPTIQAAVFATTSQNPKAFFEVKAIDGFILQGNEFTGFGTSLGFLAANQGTPIGCPSVWTRVRNILIDSNWYHTADHQFQVMGFTLTPNYYCTSMGGGDIVVSNNLITAGSILARLSNGDDVSFIHNTATNDGGGPQLIQQEAASSLDDTIGFIYRDNIAFQNTYGINCSYGVSLGCVPSAVIGTNLFIGPLINGPWCGSGYPAGNVCVNSQSAVQFVNAAGNDYRLQVGSPGKGTGSGGTDMGVNWTTLSNELGFDPSTGSPVSITTCKWNTSPPCGQ